MITVLINNWNGIAETQILILRIILKFFKYKNKFQTKN